MWTLIKYFAIYIAIGIVIAKIIEYFDTIHDIELYTMTVFIWPILPLVFVVYLFVNAISSLFE